MGTPRRPDQRPQIPVPYAPGSRSGAGATLQLSTTGLALDSTVAQVNSTLGTPTQQGTLAGLLSQIQTAGAQPWVPGMQSASAILKAPGSGPYTIHTFTAPARVWGATVTVGAGSTGGSGTTNIYSLVKTGGGVVLAMVEICVAGAVNNDSGTDSRSIPGIPVLTGDKVIFDVNGTATLSGGLIRASCYVLFSVP